MRAFNGVTLDGFSDCIVDTCEAWGPVFLEFNGSGPLFVLKPVYRQQNGLTVIIRHRWPPTKELPFTGTCRVMMLADPPLGSRMYRLAYWDAAGRAHELGVY